MSQDISSKSNSPSAEELGHCIELLEAIVANPMIIAQLSEAERVRFFKACGLAIRPSGSFMRKKRRALRRAEKAAVRDSDRSARSGTAIRLARGHSFYVPPPQLMAPEQVPSLVRELVAPDNCYICKAPFTTLHHFYDSLCPPCATLNYEKRFQSCSLVGSVAVITGARVKIGYQAALMMLRAGAHVIVTTRFPRDAARRYAQETDFSAWGKRLDIFGLDLRHAPSVEAFTRYMSQRYERLDIIINNAAQTVRRPPGFYAHLMEGEGVSWPDLPPEVRPLLLRYEECRNTFSCIAAPALGDDGARWVSEWHSLKSAAPLGLLQTAELSQIPYLCDDERTLAPTLFPAGKLDADQQQVDLRRTNTWRMKLADVPTAELIEVQLINSIAPFILCSKLKPLMLRDRTGQKHIVNVSAMEGKFTRHTKTDKHPHTNMAKAALNMMTLTSARDYAEDGIFMNAVDTGWVTDEDPAEISQRKERELDFQPPLDIVDGAARVLDPIFTGIRTGQPIWGNFLKDYAPTDW